MNWKYIAGFFDGEGSITKNGKGFRITISQTNQEVLTEIKEFTQIGKIFKNKKRKNHWKDSWVYYVARQEDVYKFIYGIEKFLIVKRAKVKKIIPNLEKILKQQKIKNDRSQHIRKTAKLLRKKGLTYRQIGEKLDIDFGHARRLILK